MIVGVSSVAGDGPPSRVGNKSIEFIDLICDTRMDRVLSEHSSGGSPTPGDMVLLSEFRLPTRGQLWTMYMVGTFRVSTTTTADSIINLRPNSY